MSINRIDRLMFIKMIQSGAANLANHKEVINKLNVFPVPDGDTGTNMNLSMTSGVHEINNVMNESLSTIVSALAKGLLMGARGNSGVILSQLFRGLSLSLKNKEEIDPKDFAIALKSGVEVAYQSVTNPVEGTMLTVAKDVAELALKITQDDVNFTLLLEEMVDEANRSLERTPELLPILKEVGVVDSGGKGLTVIYEGFLSALKGQEIMELTEENMESMIQLEHERSVQSFIDVDSIEYGYCTEFFVEFDRERLRINPFDEHHFRLQLSEYGDSLLVAADDKVVKIHIHTEYPGKVMTFAQQFGQLTNIDIENMRKQYSDIIKEEKNEPTIESGKEFGIITVALGKGIKDTLTSLGATAVIEGGQTMNPSTEDFLHAMKTVNADHTFIIPNNKNVLLAAKQAKELAKKPITIIPTTTIPQGISALFSFDENLSIEENEINMKEAMQTVKTGLVTYATRDTVIHDLEIKENHYIGIDDDTIKVTNCDKLLTVQSLVKQMIDEEDEIITVFYGEDVTNEEIHSIKKFVLDHFEDLEVEIHEGNQPVYSFILMIE